MYADDEQGSVSFSSSRDSEAPTPQMPEGEFDELMNRNRAIASSAITKAVSGATAG